MMQIRISTRLWLMVGFSFFLFISAIVIGWNGLKVSEAALQAVEENSLESMELLSEIADVQREIRTEAYRLFLHDPLNRNKQHVDRTVDVHLDAITRRLSENERLWKLFTKTIVNDVEQEMARDYAAKEARWADHLSQFLATVKANDFHSKAVLDFQGEGNAVYFAAMNALTELRAYQVTLAKESFQQTKAHYHSEKVAFLLLAMGGIFGLLTAAWLLLQRIAVGLNEAIASTKAIAGGTLSAPLPSCYPDEIGELLENISVMRDSLRQQIADIRISNGRSQAILHTMSDGVVQIDGRGTILAINPVGCELFGYEEQELIGRNISMLMPEPNRSAHDGYLARYLTTRKPVATGARREVEALRKDGRSFIMDLSVNEMIDDTGTTFIGVMRDITARKEAKQNLQNALLAAENANKLIREVIASLPIGFTIYDEGDRLLLSNEAYLHYHETSRDLIVEGKSFEEIIRQGAERGQYAAAVGCVDDWVRERVRLHQQADGTPFEQQLGDGRWLLLIEYRTPSGYIVGNRIDITELKNAQESLANARDEADQANHAKGEFLAKMSHEIRTPINAILGFSHLCLMLDLPPRAKNYVKKTNTAADSLLGIINDILDFSKIQVGKLNLETVPFSLSGVLNAIFDLFSLPARQKGIELVIGAMPEIPDRIVGDPLRLRQVLTNLISNALKFTQSGEISLTVKLLDQTEDSIVLRFDVNDTGMGMTPDQQTRIFTAFEQADTTTTRKFGGTGLGLAISKQLVEQMGGEIGVVSTPGQGSHFQFTAVFGTASDKVLNALPRSVLNDKRVLLVDDNKVMRHLLSRSLNAFGCEVVMAHSGYEALNQLALDDSFHVLMLDWRMPEMDGLEVARRIRSSGNPVPIILVTGDEPDEARALAGLDDIQAFIRKPVSRSTLFDTLSNVLSGRAILPNVGGGATSIPGLAGKRILLVDDNEFNRQVGRELVEMTGAEVDTVDDGAQSVVAVEQNRYDLVLMDLQMPGMDGYTAASCLREHWPELPILALTAHAMVEERERVLEAGMNDILTKPIQPEVLYAKLAEWLSVEPIEINHQPEIVVQSERHAIGLDEFDRAQALSRANGNPKLLARFLRLFQAHNGSIVADMRAACQAGDWEDARRLAHTLKGGAGTVGMLKLQAASAALETALTNPPQSAASLQELAALEIVWERTLAILEQILEEPAGH